MTAAAGPVHCSSTRTGRTSSGPPRHLSTSGASPAGIELLTVGAFARDTIGCRTGVGTVMGMPGPRRPWTAEEFEAAVQSSTSLAQVIGRLGLRVAGGNYATVRGAIDHAGLDPTFVASRGTRGSPWARADLLATTSPPAHDQFPSSPGAPDPRRSPRVEVQQVRRDRMAGPTHPTRARAPGWELRQRPPGKLGTPLPTCHAQTPTYRSRNRQRA